MSAQGLVPNDDVEATVRGVLRDHGKLAVAVDDLAPDTDLYRAGLTSHASVNVMLAIEDAFDVEFPERLLRKSTFGSVASLVAAVDEIVGTA